MREVGRQLEEVCAAVRPAGIEDVELYCKVGRSRRAALGAHGQIVSMHRERGWAVRASGKSSSLFCCGCGELRTAGPWPSPDGYPVRLPSPRPVSDWREPAEFQAPLSVEHEALEILEACGRELLRELPGSRLLQATLEDGESSSELVNTRGVEARARHRAATLFLEAALGDDSVIEFVGARTARDFNPRSLARRLADRLLIRRDGASGERDRVTLLLAPPVAVRLLAGLLPSLLGVEGGEAVGKGPGGGEIGSNVLDIVDDGRLGEGLFCAPVDGEGMPTGRTILVEKGELRAPLLSAAVVDEPGGVCGRTRRPSYRDVPRVGVSHLFIEPNRKQPAGTLLAGMNRGMYAVEALDSGRFDLEGDRFEISIGGFSVRSGRPIAPIAGARLSGQVSRLLKGVQAVARDLTFYPIAGLLGSPSLLVEGLEINRPSPF